MHPRELDSIPEVKFGSHIVREFPETCNRDIVVRIMSISGSRSTGCSRGRELLEELVTSLDARIGWYETAKRNLTGLEGYCDVDPLKPTINGIELALKTCLAYRTLALRNLGELEDTQAEPLHVNEHTMVGFCRDFLQRIGQSDPPRIRALLEPDGYAKRGETIFMSYDKDHVRRFTKRRGNVSEERKPIPVQLGDGGDPVWVLNYDVRTRLIPALRDWFPNFDTSGLDTILAADRRQVLAS